MPYASLQARVKDRTDLAAQQHKWTFRGLSIAYSFFRSGNLFKTATQMYGGGLQALLCFPWDRRA